MRQVARQHRLADRFVAANPRVPVVAVAALAQDVHDLDGLRLIGEQLGLTSPEHGSAGGAAPVA